MYIILLFSSKEGFEIVVDLIKVDLKKKPLIDMQYHNIRYYCMIISFWLRVIKKNKQEKDQISRKLITVNNSEIIECMTWKEYNIQLYKNKDLNISLKPRHSLRKLPIFEYNKDKSEYKIYYEIIKKYIEYIKNKIADIVHLKESYLCPYESIILYYMYMRSKVSDDKWDDYYREKIRANGDVRKFADVIGRSPFTLYNKLNGWSKFSKEQRKMLRVYFASIHIS
jgi:hypothetical protein